MTPQVITMINDKSARLRADIRADIGSCKTAKELSAVLNMAEAAIRDFRYHVNNILSDACFDHVHGDLSYGDFELIREACSDARAITLNDIWGLAGMLTWGPRPSHADLDAWSWDQDGAVYYDGWRWTYVQR